MCRRQPAQSALAFVAWSHDNRGPEILGPESVLFFSLGAAIAFHGIPLHLRPGAREWYAAWLSREHPHLVPRHRTLFANGAY